MAPDVGHGLTLKLAHLTTVDSSLRYLLLPQLRHAKELGFEVVGISGMGNDVPYLESLGIRHRSLRSSTRSFSLVADLRSAWQLRQVLRDEGVDILHTHNPKPGIYGRIVGRLSGIPVVVNTVHGLYATETDSLAKRMAVWSLEWLAAWFSDAELVQNVEDVETMRRLSIGRPGKTVHLGNGVDLERFRPARDPTVRGRIRSELGLSPQDVVVGCVARLVAEKGIPELLDAWANRESHYTLVIVGPFDPTKPDAIRSELVDAARDQGVRFLGHRDDMEEIYQALDLFVLPSHREGFPRAAMEAAASGLPVVTTDIRGCRQVVEHGRNGLLVKVKDRAALAAAIDALVSDPDRRAEMSRQGRLKAEEEFDETNVVETVFAAYLDAARRKGLADIEAGLSVSQGKRRSVGG